MLSARSLGGALSWQWFSGDLAGERRDDITRSHSASVIVKERINLKALKLLESFSRLACHCDALVFLFYRSPVTPLPERRRNALLRYYAFARG
jgi:hypothetical protein